MKSGNLNRKRGQQKPQRQSKRGRPCFGRKSAAVLAPLITALVILATEIVKLFGK